ncbi:MAG TPA: lysoplasmalogenase family protein [Caulobacter sp.]|nr:lysoplasmalogenase family protein [Caulobacter sp.]
MTRDQFAKIVLLAAIAGGVSFVLSWGQGLPPGVELAWKGSGVGLLAVYAALKARSLDGWLLVAVMALGATGDVLLGAISLMAGAIAFLAGHLVAIGLYLRNHRPNLSRSQRLLAVVLVPATVAIAWMLPADRAGAAGIALYSFGLAVMAACAWISRFPRFWTGLGAVMFVVSDLLIFARLGPLPDTFETGLAVWGLYFAGQLMICLGVTGKLAEDR